jgi:hypothetical protein
MNDQRSLFDEVDVIYTYTRAQAIADGVLIDVTETAREAGVRFPAAVTAGLWHKYIVPDEASRLHCQSTEGRLWDTLWLFRWAAKNFSGDTLFFEVSYVMIGRQMTRAKLKAVCGPGDTPEPVITIMLPDED